MKYLSLKAMIALRDYFEKKLEGFNIQICDHGKRERIYILEDSLVLLVQFLRDSLPVCGAVERLFSEYINHPYLELPVESGEYYDFVVEELTPNEINFKFDRCKFIEETECLFNMSDIGLDISYIKFKGYHRLYWCPDIETTAERINRQIPALKLKARYDSWPGKLYNYIIYEVKDKKGEIYYAVSYTRSSPRAYVNNMGKEYIKTGNFSNINTRCGYSAAFDNALHSWKGISRQKNLEEHLQYFVIQKHQKEFDDTWKYGDTLLSMAKKGVFVGVERYSYIKPANKWITEELVYKLTKKMFKQYNVIYQHRPFYLKSSVGGQMSYDVFISELDIAIEYQGKQHFQPVEFFGGEEGFESLKKRDARKLELSKEHGVKLIYINYWEEVNEALIRTRVEEAIKSRISRTNI